MVATKVSTPYVIFTLKRDHILGLIIIIVVSKHYISSVLKSSW